MTIVSGDFELVENEKIALITHLHKHFSEISLESISGLFDGFDSVLTSFLAECLIRNAKRVFHAEKISHGQSSFEINRRAHVLEMSTPITKTTCLQVGIIVRESKPTAQEKDFLVRKFRLAGFGKFSEVEYVISKSCQAADLGLLEQLTKSIFLSGYNWLNERTIGCVGRACDAFNQALYEHVRIVVPDQQLLNGFLFSAAFKGKDIAVLSDSALKMAIQLAGPAAANLGRSAADIVVQWMTQIIPLADSSIVDAAQQGDEGILVDLAQDVYYKADKSFSDSLRAVWGDSVFCLPILRSDQLILVAFYLPTCRAALEPILLAHRNHLKKIATEKLEGIVKGFNVLSRIQGIRPAAWGEAIGAGLAEFLQRMGKP
jgi:hypothetical protein